MYLLSYSVGRSLNLNVDEHPNSPIQIVVAISALNDSIALCNKSQSNTISGMLIKIKNYETFFRVIISEIVVW